MYCRYLKNHISCFERLRFANRWDTQNYKSKSIKRNEWFCHVIVNKKYRRIPKKIPKYPTLILSSKSNIENLITVLQYFFLTITFTGTGDSGLAAVNKQSFGLQARDYIDDAIRLIAEAAHTSEQSIEEWPHSEMINISISVQYKHISDTRGTGIVVERWQRSASVVVKTDGKQRVLGWLAT